MLLVKARRKRENVDNDPGHKEPETEVRAKHHQKIPDKHFEHFKHGEKITWARMPVYGGVLGRLFPSPGHRLVAEPLKVLILALLFACPPNGHHEYRDKVKTNQNERFATHRPKQVQEVPAESQHDEKTPPMMGMRGTSMANPRSIKTYFMPESS